MSDITYRLRYPAKTLAFQLTDPASLPAWFGMAKGWWVEAGIITLRGTDSSVYRVNPGEWIVYFPDHGIFLSPLNDTEFRRTYEEVTAETTKIEDYLDGAREQFASLIGDFPEHLESEDLFRRLMRPLVEWLYSTFDRKLRPSEVLKVYIHVAAYMALQVNRVTRPDHQLTDGLVNLLGLIQKEALVLRTYDDAEGFEIEDVLLGPMENREADAAAVETQQRDQEADEDDTQLSIAPPTSKAIN